MHSTDIVYAGVRHEGTPEGNSIPCIASREYMLTISLGTFSDVAGVKCYITEPSGDYDQSKVVIYLCDAFGIELVNNRVRRCTISEDGGTQSHYYLFA